MCEIGNHIKEHVCCQLQSWRHCKVGNMMSKMAAQLMEVALLARGMDLRLQNPSSSVGSDMKRHAVSNARCKFRHLQPLTVHMHAGVDRCSGKLSRLLCCVRCLLCQGVTLPRVAELAKREGIPCSLSA